MSTSKVIVMKNLYVGKSVASVEMMNLEVVNELINSQKMRVLFAGIDKKHQQLVDNKLDELDELSKNLYTTDFQTVIQIKQSLKKELDDFLENIK